MSGSLGGRAAIYVAIATFLHRAHIGRPFAGAFLPAVGNGLEALAALALLRRFQFDPTFRRLRDVFALIATAAIAPMVSTTLAELMYILPISPQRGIAGRRVGLVADEHARGSWSLPRRS